MKGEAATKLEADFEEDDSFGQTYDDGKNKNENVDKVKSTRKRGRL